VQVVAFGLLLADPAAGPQAFVVAWGLGAAAASALGFWSLRVAPRPDRASEWFTRDRARVGSFLVNFGLVTGSSYLAIYVVGFVAGLTAVAALRGAQLLFAPLDSLITGVRVFALPALGRAATRSERALRARAGEFSVVAGVLVVLWAAVLLELPDAIGRAVLGRSWQVAQPVLLAIAVGAVARTVSMPALDGIRALGGGRILVASRVVVSVLILVGAVLGAFLGGAVGAAAGLALALSFGAAIWWRGLIRAGRSPGAAAEAGPEPLTGGYSP
jgi:O-antigen/teichoic acid export membrane protein